MPDCLCVCHCCWLSGNSSLFAPSRVTKPHTHIVQAYSRSWFVLGSAEVWRALSRDHSVLPANLCIYLQTDWSMPFKLNLVLIYSIYRGNLYNERKVMSVLLRMLLWSCYVEQQSISSIAFCRSTTQACVILRTLQLVTVRRVHEKTSCLMCH